MASNIILSTSKDYAYWIELIKTAALEQDIWKYINPDAAFPILFPPEPVRPSPSTVKGPIIVPQTTRQAAQLGASNPAQGTRSQASSSASTLASTQSTPDILSQSPVNSREPQYSDLNQDERDYLRSLVSQYEEDRRDYKRQKEALARIRTKIQETLDPRHFVYARDESPYKVLVRLQERFRPTDYARKQELRTTWLSLQRTNKVTDLEAWLQSWESCYDDCLEIGLPDVQDDWATTAFLDTLRMVSPAYAETAYFELAKGATLGFRETLQSYRRWSRNMNAFSSKPRRQPAGFTTDSTDSTTPTASTNPIPTLQGKDKNGRKKTCLCGDTHAWSKCPYMFEWNRPQGWKEDAAIQQLIGEKSKNPVVQKTLQQIRDKRTAITSAPDTPQAGSDVPRGATAFRLQAGSDVSRGATAVRSVTAIQTTHYALVNSFILDSGATDHVANDRSRFTGFTDAQEGEYLVAGSDLAPIIGWGNVKITFQTPSGPREFELYNTAYIPTFNVNVVSYNRLHDKQIYWDPRNLRLEYCGRTVATTARGHGQWLLEYNPVPNPMAYPALSTRTARPKATWTIQQAHDRLGHLNPEALSHLPQACSDIEKVTGTLEPSCQTCRESDAKRIISRRVPERASHPFYRLCWDAIPIRNGYVSHIYDDFLGYHFAWIVRTTRAAELVGSIRKTVNFIRRQCSLEVAVIRMDVQVSIVESEEWTDYLEASGLLVELSAPDTHEQNGAAERSGGVLTLRARKLKHLSSLPETMMPELYLTAAYLLNRSPTRRLEWDSPLGKLQKHRNSMATLPKLAHLRSYGCRAYVLNPHIDKLDRLEPRTHIGYLIGYESTNIFRVWIPKLSRVINTRDVTFDEACRYTPNEDFTDVTERLITPLELFSLDTLEDPEADQPTQALLPYERSIDAPGDTIVADHGIDTESPVEPVIGLPTPDLTPEPEATRAAAVTHLDPRQIGLNPKRADQREAYAAALESLHYKSVYHTAFLDGASFKHAKLHRSDLPPAPAGWMDMLSHPHKAGFEAAARVEYADLNAQGTFTPTLANKVTAFVIPTRWVFTYKFDEEGFLLKYKARLVVRGNLQPDLQEETYAATLAARVFRFLMAISAYFDLDAQQFDAINAFTNAKLRSKVWVQYPPGMKHPGFVLLLQRALYGLRVSPLLWFDLLSQVMKKLGLSPVPECACLFQNHQLIVFFYVDDIVVLFHRSNRAAYEAFRTGLMSNFNLREIGELKWFLGIRVVRDRIHHKIWLCQDSYISKLAAKFNLEHQKVRTPLLLEPLLKFEGQATPHATVKYQRKVGSINYPASITRPDCARALQKLSEFLQNPGPAHEAAVDRCIAYLYSTRCYALEYGALQGQEPIFRCASDASFADEPTRRWSTEGGLFQLFGGSLDWFSTLQRTVTTSSTEAELLALSHICAWLFWWRRVFENLSLDLDSETTVNCDNLQTVRLMMKEAPKLVTKLKHVDIHQHWLRQETTKGTVKVEWISTVEMPADGFTKPLGPQKHSAFLKQLNLVDITSILDQTSI